MTALDTPRSTSTTFGVPLVLPAGPLPFALGPVSLFPLLGIEYDLNLYLKDADGTDLKAGLTDQEKADLNQFWFKAGAGADFVVYKGLYVRPLVLMGFKLLTRENGRRSRTAIDAAALPSPA